MRCVYLTEFLWRLTLTYSRHPGWSQALARCSLRLIVGLLNQSVREFTKLANLMDYSIVSLQQFNHPAVWRQPNFLAPCCIVYLPPPPHLWIHSSSFSSLGPFLSVFKVAPFSCSWENTSWFRVLLTRGLLSPLSTSRFPCRTSWLEGHWLLYFNGIRITCRFIFKCRLPGGVYRFVIRPSWISSRNLYLGQHDCFPDILWTPCTWKNTGADV